MTTTKRLHPGLRPNPSLPAYTDGNHPADQASRSKVLETWARQWGTADELVLLASSRGEARNLNLLARSALRTAGRLVPQPLVPQRRAAGVDRTGFLRPPGRPDCDYFAVPEDEIRFVRPVLTVVGGRVAHDPGLLPSA